MQSRGLTLVLVLTVVLSGCAGFSGLPSARNDTETSTVVTNESTSVAVDSPRGYSVPRLSFADSALTHDGVDISPINLTADRHSPTDENMTVTVYFSFENTADSLSTPPLPDRFVLQIGDSRYYPVNTPLLRTNEYSSMTIAPNTTHKRWLSFEVPRDVDGDIFVVLTRDVSDAGFSPGLYWSAPNGSL